jgi:hypothetical protein
VTTYCVTLPIKGLYVAEVEAETAEEAILKAVDRVGLPQLDEWKAQIREAHAEPVSVGAVSDLFAESAP